VFRFRLSGILLSSCIYTLQFYYTGLTLKTEAASSSETLIYTSRVRQASFLFFILQFSSEKEVSLSHLVLRIIVRLSFKLQRRLWKFRALNRGFDAETIRFTASTFGVLSVRTVFHTLCF
jgi:hypothetical protein